MIKLQFVQSADIGSRAIEIFERGWPSHVDIVLPDNRLLGARIDGGVSIRSANYGTWTRTQVVTLASENSMEQRFYAFLTEQLGKPYDETAIAAFPLQRDWREPDSWFCSELAAAALEACGFFPEKLSNSVNEITPRDLLLVLSPWNVG